jgi:hypothetical protein
MRRPWTTLDRIAAADKSQHSALSRCITYFNYYRKAGNKIRSYKIKTPISKYIVLWVIQKYLQILAGKEHKNSELIKINKIDNNLNCSYLNFKHPLHYMHKLT